MTVITWAEIEAEYEAETGDYRSRVVAIFRKYEGRDTDEIAGNGQIVRVTVASFARHMHIPEGTFRDWVKLSDQEEGTERHGRDHAGAARRFASKLPPEEKDELERELREEREQRQQERLEREVADMRRRGADPDSPPEPLPHDLIAEARRIAERADVSRDVTALLARAEADQRPALVQIIELRVNRVFDALRAGTIKVPDDISSLEGF